MINVTHRAALIIAIAGASVSTMVDAVINDLESRSASAVVDARSFAELPLNCRDLQSVVSQTATTSDTTSMTIRGIRPLNGGAPLPLVDGIYPPATGVQVSVFNASDDRQSINVQILCATPPPFGAGTVAGVVNMSARSSGKGYADCPPGHFATGGGYSADGIQFRTDYPYWRDGPQLSQRLPGLQDGPTGWGVDVDNPGDTDRLQTSYAYCLDNTDLLVRTNVLPFFVGDNVAFFRQAARANDLAIGIGVSGGPDIHATTGATWQPREDFGASGYNFTSPSDQYRVGPGGSIGRFFANISKTFARSAAAGPTVEVKMALIITPSAKAAPPVTIVQAVEFYHAASDHYFITSIAREISDLDTKVHPGWQRTGQSFNVYAAGSGGPIDRFPVCRYYGLPQAGLDSHFYTGGVHECLEVGAKFAGAWGLESGEVFQVLIPDPETGACPPGTIPVMRSWNQRTDSNHRYTIVEAIRDSMVNDHGHTAEGYGPKAVVFCAPA